MKRYSIALVLIIIASEAKAQLRMDSAKVVAPPAMVSFTDPSPSFKPLLPAQPVASNFYAQHLPFFCRQELKMEQAHIPLKVRVGNIDDANWLERKPGYMYRP